MKIFNSLGIKNFQNQRPYQKTKYLGVVVDKKKKIFERKARRKEEKLILDFGDTYILNCFLEEKTFVQLIKNIFAEQSETILALLYYRVCYGSAMVYAQSWFEGNYAKILFKNVSFSSQRISSFLVHLGDEKLQRSFFAEYIHLFCNAKRGVVIDGTSLPNQIHMPLTAWGLSSEEIDKQIRFLLIVDKDTKNPLFFRLLPGNMLDVSTLRNTLDELERYNIKNSFVYVDAGFFSEENVREMYEHKVQFLTRLPSLRIIYKQLIEKDLHDIESIQYAVRYGKRGMFVKQKEIDLFGKKAYAHIILDPERKGREMKKFILNVTDEKDKHKGHEMEYMLKTRGIMILISSLR